ncbi:hypothetical protein [uncultured Ligilactobacillus sp.]|uniref:hypothetical protein n=1 Tax=uncultured Ligilactobacillus sp. TaxID=2837633 RepID=UPI00338EB00C
MSVNSQYNDQKFTDKSLENAGLSVKCVLLTDRSAKNGTLSVITSWHTDCAGSAFYKKTEF